MAAKKNEELFFQVKNCTVNRNPSNCIYQPEWFYHPSHLNERCNPPASGAPPACAQYCEISYITDNYLRYSDADFDVSGDVDDVDYAYFFGAAGPTFMTGLGKTVRPGEDYKRVNWHKDNVIDWDDGLVFNRGKVFCYNVSLQYPGRCSVCDDDRTSEHKDDYDDCETP